MTGRILLALALFAIIAPANFAQKPSSSWFARSWESDEGLPDNNVIGVAQSADRYLWVATLGGLVRFDGARFQEFSPALIPGVPNRVVRAMHMDRSGRLWLGMDRGALACLDGRGAKVVGVKNGLPDQNIAQIVVDSEGAAWLAYESGELFTVRDGAPERFDGKAGPPTEGRASLALDTNNVLWIAKGREIGQFNGGSFRRGVKWPRDNICLAAARHGGVWACGGDQLLRLDSNFAELQKRELPAQLHHADVAVVFEDQSGSVWIGTRGRGLFRSDDQSCESIDTSHRQILALAEDHEGNIWAGTGGGGLNRLRPRDVELLSVESGLPFEAIQSVAEDSQGRLWAVAQNGALARKDGDKWIAVTAESGWTGERAMCVTAGKEGSVWIGLRNGGLCRFQNGQVSRWRKGAGLASDAVRSLLLASNGDLWIGTDNPGEVQRLRDHEFKTFPTPQPARSIRAMAEDQRGTIWIGASEGQLLRVAGDELIVDPATVEPRRFSIRSLCPGSDGALWIGYAGAGLGRLKGDEFMRFTTGNGLPENYISQIVSDEQGWLWIGGNRGIFRVAEQDLGEVAANPAINRVRSFVYGRGEGLASVQASFDTSPGALRSRCGDLWIPLRKGLAVIRPRAFARRSDPGAAIIERVLLDDRVVGLYESQPALRERLAPAVANFHRDSAAVRLQPNYRKVTFEFTAPSFSSPENLHFQYRLKGFDSDWNEAAIDRKASYGRLAAGDYTFEVRAWLNGGAADLATASLALTIPPVYWQTWWFRTSCFIASALLIGAAVRYWSVRRIAARMQQLEREAALQRERARIAKDIHDDLGANLTQIALLSELAQQDGSSQSKANERIEKISTTAREVIKSLDEIVWAVNPGNDSLPHLIDYAAQFVLDYLRLAGIRCRLDLPENPPHYELSTDVRHNIFLVIKEAANNIVKHSGATEVWLRLRIVDDTLQIAIEDNGRGLEGSSRNGRGNGLVNMEKRIAEIGGVYQLASRAQNGASVRFTVPLTT